MQKATPEEPKLVLASNACEIAHLIVKEGGYKTYFHLPLKEWPVWADGTIAPVYCNIRSLLGKGQIIKAIGDSITEMARQMDISREMAIVGLASAGIPWASIIGYKLGIGIGYDRGKPKDHGTYEQIEDGLLERNINSVFIVDDAISSGGSVLRSIKVLMDNGIKVKGVIVAVAISDRSCVNQWCSIRVPIGAVTDYNHLISIAVEEGKISREQSEELIRFYKNPTGQFSWN